VSHAYGARTIKRRERRTRAQVDQLDSQIIAVLEEDNPQSVRHVFYRITDPRLPEPVEKSDRGYRHIQRRCLELRRSGKIPYGWISDATQRGYFTRTYNSGADFLRAVKGLYRADLWARTPDHVEVWVESRSLAGVVQDDCRALAVSLYPTGGFSSATLTYEAVGGGHQQLRNLQLGDLLHRGLLSGRGADRQVHREGDQAAPCQSPRHQPG
jgi:hypothetical protein